MPAQVLTEDPRPRYAATQLRSFAEALFLKAGIEAAKVPVIAEILLEADLMGNNTHGLALASRYLEEIESGAMVTSGEPEVISDRGACICWNGRQLPGTWLIVKAIDLGVERAATHGTTTIAIANSHHIGSLGAYLSRVTTKGCMIFLSSSNHSLMSVAPFGGMRPALSPNPIAAGIPTDEDPILLDTSASLTTNNMARRLIKEGRRFPNDCLLDQNGKPSNDPAVLSNGGSILPVGGLEYGHKGYSWALLVEALTQGLGGYGRADLPTDWGASVFMQIIDPAAFAGIEAFTRQTTFVARVCRDTPPIPGRDAVRLPGDLELARRREALQNGVILAHGIVDNLQPWADKLGVRMPDPLNVEL